MKRIGIINRGEAAIRFLRTLTELRGAGNAAPTGIALYTEPDRESLYVQQADEAICIGGGRQAYLDAKRVIEALKQMNCDAAWPGWGFAAEDADFAQAVEQAGITWIGPRPETIQRLGNKIDAKRLAESLGVDVAGWQMVDTIDQALAAADRIGYPLLLKAAAGGGGRGIRQVNSPGELPGLFNAATLEVQRSFGSSGLMVEELIPDARHIEVQVFGDGTGRIVTFGVRDCTLQRRRQKLFEESPSNALSTRQIDQACERARSLCSAVTYRNAGTVEFLYRPADQRLLFMEVNTRLQVEHPVTEERYGLDLVQLQIDLARGRPLPAQRPDPGGWAIEARIYAEDAARDFAPAPGILRRISLASGAGLRIDCGVAEGETISDEFDPLIAKLIARGPTRDVAIARLARGLRETTLLLEGGTSNLAYLRHLLTCNEATERATIGTIDRLDTWQPPHGEFARIASAIDRFSRQQEVNGSLFAVELDQPSTLMRTDIDRYRLRSDRGVIDLRWQEHDSLRATLSHNGQSFVIHRVPGDHYVHVDGYPHRIEWHDAGTLTAPGPALVLQTLARPGDRVEAGAPLAILESMKMEIRLGAPCAGVVSSIEVAVGEHVSAGQTLVRLESSEERQQLRSGFPWRQPRVAESGVTRRMAALLSGWDFDRQQFECDLKHLPLSNLDRLLETFVDLAELFDRRSFSGGITGVATEPRELIVERVIENGADSLSEVQKRRFQRARRHVGLKDDDRALSRLVRAGERLDLTCRIATSILQKRPAVDRLLLERVCALNSRRFPELCQTARHLRFERFGSTTSQRPARSGRLAANELDGLLRRWRAFELTPIADDAGVLVYEARARTSPDDLRLLALVLVDDLRQDPAEPGCFPGVESVFYDGLLALQQACDKHDARRRGTANRLLIYVRPKIELPLKTVRAIAERLAPATRGVGLEKVELRARLGDGMPWIEWTISNPTGLKLSFAMRPASDTPIEPRTPYQMRVIQARRRGTIYPYELIRFLTGGDPLPPGGFLEYDLDDDGGLEDVSHRSYGQNRCGVVFGIISNQLPGLDAGFQRVLILSDPTRQMGSLAEPECRRIIAALDLAEALEIPVEWLPVSSGARIDWETGTENLDWTARVLRRIIDFTQRGGAVNIIVDGICVGAQAYWNAEATMMMHTRGLLIQTDQGTMVLTGKRALEFSGCVAGRDNKAIGGFSAVMGPNGQAQAFAPDLESACRLLFRYYRVTSGAGQRTLDRIERNVCLSPYPADLEHGFSAIGDIFSTRLNPDRKRPFAIRPVMAAVVDVDSDRIERWAAAKDAETAVVWETAIGGTGLTLIGIESQPLLRNGQPPTDGPSSWSAGTLYPRSAWKIARAINASSGNRPVVVLANLSGFDGSPESLRRWQLEYGAEIGRAVVNFKGRLVFCVISRYHGGAYVVFSRALNPGLVTLAVEGSYASVIGGAPAAAVVFARDVRRLSRSYGDNDAARTRAIGELAERFDQIHTVERALSVGSLDAVIRAEELRPAIVHYLSASGSDGRQPVQERASW